MEGEGEDRAAAARVAESQAACWWNPAIFSECDWIAELFYFLVIRLAS